MKKSSINILASSAFLLLAGAVAWISIRFAGAGDAHSHLEPTPKTDTLRVAMLNAPYSYYHYRDTIMGFDYELANALADSLHRPLKIVEATSMVDLIEKVATGEADLAAAPVADTSPHREEVALCGPERISYQVLVQRGAPGKVKDVTDLPSHTVTVIKDTRYDQRIANLNKEIGGGIAIEALDRDTLTEGDLVKMVSKGEIEMTLTDSQLAEYGRRLYPSLDFSVPVSLEQRLRWAVNPADTLLAKAIDRWSRADSVAVASTYRKYYAPAPTVREEESAETDASGRSVASSPGSYPAIPYVAVFKQVCARHGIDWRLAAAVAFVESRFKPEIVSWAGARGIMQVMPGTARGMGIDPSKLTRPDVCIEAGVRLLSNLDKALASRIPDPRARRDFMLASYNAGLGHIYDAIALARKYGLDASHWEGGVSRAALMKSKPKYYHDPVVKNGYFRARETLDFVHSVNDAYLHFSRGN